MALLILMFWAFIWDLRRWNRMPVSTDRNFEKASFSPIIEAQLHYVFAIHVYYGHFSFFVFYFKNINILYLG